MHGFVSGFAAFDFNHHNTALRVPRVDVDVPNADGQFMLEQGQTNLEAREVAFQRFVHLTFRTVQLKNFLIAQLERDHQARRIKSDLHEFARAAALRQKHYAVVFVTGHAQVIGLGLPVDRLYPSSAVNLQATIGFQHHDVLAGFGQ